MIREKRYEELSEEELRNTLEALKEIAEYTSKHEVDKSTPFCDMRLYAEGKNHAKHKVNEILIKYCIA